MALICIHNEKEISKIVRWYNGFTNIKRYKPFKHQFTEGTILLEYDNLAMDFNCENADAKLVNINLTDNSTEEWIVKFTINVFDHTVSVDETNKKYHAAKAFRKLQENEAIIQVLAAYYVAISSFSYYCRRYMKVKKPNGPHKEGNFGGVHKERFLNSKIYEIEEKYVRGRHNSPSFAHLVRAHDRHYKSGKVVHVDAFIRCKEAGNYQDPIYVVDNNDPALEV